MEDERIREMETTLWIGEGSIYREHVAEQCIAVLPDKPFLLAGPVVQQRLEHTPRWESVELADLSIHRAQEGLIVIGYHAHAARGDQRFSAYCTSTYRRRGEHDWEVIQHQQSVVPAAG